MDDREWMYTGWFGKRDWMDEFVQKVEDFLKKAFEEGQSKAPCPCCRGWSPSRGRRGPRTANVFAVC